MKALKRVFYIGRKPLPDPDPTASVSEVQAIHAKNYPMLHHTNLFENSGVPEVVDGEMALVFKYVLPPQKVNG